MSAGHVESRSSETVRALTVARFASQHKAEHLTDGVNYTSVIPTVLGVSPERRFSLEDR